MPRKAKRSTVDVQALADRLKVLADPKRLLILKCLMDDAQCNCNLGDALDMAPNLVSHHLSVLRQAGLIEMQRDAQDGRWIYYSVNKATLAELTAAFNDFFDPTQADPRVAACGPKCCDTAAPDRSVRQPEAVAVGD